MQNSDRFLNSFSKIEQILRRITNSEKSTPFYELVRRASNRSTNVRYLQNDLKEFADLRNAIVHERTDGHVIAEPNDWAVSRILEIEKQLTDPPKVIPLFQTEVQVISTDDSIADAIKIMFEKSFSQMPVYHGNTFVNLLTANTISRWLGSNVNDDIFSLSETTISEVLNYTEEKDNYCFLGRNSSLFEVLEKFQTYERKGKSWKPF